MAGLKAWNGSAFVDGEPRIWNGSAFVAPSTIHVWNGSAFVKVWPSFVRQRMNKNGNYAVQVSWNRITGWASDATYPATITSNQLVVQGGGSATVTLSVRFAAAYINTPVELRLNGTKVAQVTSSGGGAANTQTTTWSGVLTEGDLLDAWTTAGGSPVINASPTYIDVNPT